MAPRIVQAINVDEPDRPIVSITFQGRPTNYELSVREDFGIRELTRIERWQRKINEIRNKPEPDITEEDADTIVESLDAFMIMLIRDCPPEVLAKLQDAHKMSLMEAFSNEAGASPAPPQTPNRAGRRQTPTSSSPRSSASTGGRRRTG